MSLPPSPSWNFLSLLRISLLGPLFLFFRNMHLRSQSKPLIARVLPASLLFSPSSTVAKRFRLRSTRLWLPETEVQSYSLTVIPMDCLRFRLSTPVPSASMERVLAPSAFGPMGRTARISALCLLKDDPLAELWIVVDLLIATSSLLKNNLEQVTYVSFVERSAGTLSRRLFSTSSMSMALLLSGRAIPAHHAHMIQTIASVPTNARQHTTRLSGAFGDRAYHILPGHVYKCHCGLPFASAQHLGVHYRACTVDPDTTYVPSFPDWFMHC